MQLAALENIFSEYGVQNLRAIEEGHAQDPGNFMIFFGNDDVVALINWKTMAEVLKRAGVSEDGGALKSWRYDEVHGYFIHLSKNEITRLQDLKQQNQIASNSAADEESLVLQKLYDLGYNQIKSVAFVAKSRFGRNLWRLDFKLNPVYANNRKVIEAIIEDFSRDLLLYADISDEKIGNLKRWQFNKKDHHPVVFLSNDEMQYFLSSLQGCDGGFLSLEDIDDNVAEPEVVNEDNQQNTLSQEESIFEQVEGSDQLSEEPDVQQNNVTTKIEKKFLIANKGESLHCGNVIIDISGNNIFGNMETDIDARIEYSEGNICFVDPVEPSFFIQESWQNVDNLSSKIYNQIKIDKKMIKAINKDAEISARSTVVANLIDSGLIDYEAEAATKVLPAISYIAAKGHHDFGIIHGAVNLDFTISDDDNLVNLCQFFENILMQIAIDDKFDEFRLPIILKEGLEEGENMKMLLFAANSFTEALENSIAKNIDFSEKNILLCCNNPENQRQLINNFRAIEFSRFGL